MLPSNLKVLVRFMYREHHSTRPTFALWLRHLPCLMKGLFPNRRDRGGGGAGRAIALQLLCFGFFLRWWQTRTQCCGHIVAHDCVYAAQTRKHLLRTQNIFVSRTQILCPQQMLPARANGETFVSATMCPQHCVLVCHRL